MEFFFTPCLLKQTFYDYSSSASIEGIEMFFAPFQAYNLNQRFCISVDFNQTAAGNFNVIWTVFVI